MHKFSVIMEKREAAWYDIKYKYKYERRDPVMEKENREHKDSLFVDLFYKDETAKQNLLSLYNALHDTDLKDDGLIRKIKIEDILYKNFKNDVSFEVNGNVIVFGEHQSTVNPNMPLRCLLYAGRVYEELVEEDARYRTKQVMIPNPEFYVFYNGKEDFPVEKELVLSDAYLCPPEENSLELKVKVININSDKAHKLLAKCEILREYSIFIETIRKYADSEEGAIKKAIQECMEKGILTEYLKRKGSEVRNMLIAEYSYEKDIQIKQQEARQEGWDEGWDEGILLSGKILGELRKNSLITNEQIAERIGCPLETVEEIRRKLDQ